MHRALEVYTRPALVHIGLQFCGTNTQVRDSFVGEGGRFLSVREVNQRRLCTCGSYFSFKKFLFYLVQLPSSQFDNAFRDEAIFTPVGWPVISTISG